MECDKERKAQKISGICEKLWIISVGVVPIVIAEFGTSKRNFQREISKEKYG